MKLKDYYNIVKESNINSIVLVKYGNFYRCFNNDALIMFLLFGYNVNDKISTGFPIKTINVVLKKLKDNGISCIVIKGIDDVVNFNSLNNSYNIYLNCAVNYNLLCNYKDYLSEVIEKILEKDINKYDLIKEFLSDL